MANLDVSGMLASQLVQQRERLIELLSLARQKAPYYQNTIPSDIENLISSSEQWQRIPLLEKSQIQADWMSFLIDSDAVNDPAVDILSTSGSTGTPLKIARPKSELRAQAKRLWASRARWHSDIMKWKLLNLTSIKESPAQESLELCKSKTLLDLSFDALRDHIPLIDSYQPDWMGGGSPSAVYRFAECYRRERRKIPTLKFIEVTGEELYSYQRSLIESVFECPLVNQYGCREFWILSYECPGRSMHAWTDDLLLEVIRDGRPVAMGESGELVVTSLTNRVMPLIRYRLGDFVQMSSSNCSCGNHHPILMPVEGRVGVLIVTRQRTVTTGFFSMIFSRFLMHHEQEILEYQVVQPNYDWLEIHIVPGERLKKDPTLEVVIKDELEKAIKHYLPEVNCKFVFCSRLVRTSSGKTMTFISLMNSSAVYI